MSAPVSMKYGRVRNYYGGEFVESKSSDWLDVTSPLDGAALSQVPMSTTAELEQINHKRTCSGFLSIPFAARKIFR